MELTVKPGAQIIFIKNDAEKRWVNGTLGTISGIDADGIIYVITEDGREFGYRKSVGATSGTTTTKRRRRLRKRNWEPSRNIPSGWHGPLPSTRVRD